MSPSPFITDAFTGSNGALWSPLRWSTGVSTSSVIDIQSSSGHLQVPASNNGWARASDDSTAPRNAGSTMQDADVTASVKASSIGGGLTTRIWARASGAWNTTNNYLQTAGYALVLNHASNTVALTKMTTAANTETSLGSASFTYAINTLYKVRLEVVGTTIRARIWNSTGSEPSTWNVTATDSTFASGVTAVSVNTGTNTTIRDVYVDDVAVTPATSASTLTAYDTINTYNSWGLPETVVEAATGTQTNVNQRTFTRVYNAGGLAVTDIQSDGTTCGIQITAAFDELDV